MVLRPLSATRGVFVFQDAANDVRTRVRTIHVFSCTYKLIDFQTDQSSDQNTLA